MWIALFGGMIMADDQEQMKLGGSGCCGNPENQYLDTHVGILQTLPMFRL